MQTVMTPSHYDSSTVAESTTSSTAPFLPDINNDSINNKNTLSNMSDINGKAPLNGSGTNGASRSAADEPIIKVQPPRREDLQPSYARVIQADDADADTNGWYGAMVGFELVCYGRSLLTLI
jgi:hypothetical protein